MPPTVTTILPQLPDRAQVQDDNGKFSRATGGWLLTVQNLLPLNVVDTSAGPQVLALPPAGNNATTGQSAQNREITYYKDTPDANTVTITGAKGGSVVLVAEDDFARFKSDGTKWRRIS